MSSNYYQIRQFVHDNQNCHISEIIEHIKNEFNLESDNIAYDKVKPVLRNNDEFIEQFNDKWIIKRDKMPEYALAPKLLERERKPLSKKKLKSLIRKEMGVKYTQVAFDPTKCREISQYHSRYFLSHWNVVNDLAYKYLAETSSKRTENQLYNDIERNYELPEGHNVLILSQDERFIKIDGKWTLSDFEEEKEPVEKIEEKEDSSEGKKTYLVKGDTFDIQRGKDQE